MTIYFCECKDVFGTFQRQLMSLYSLRSHCRTYLCIKLGVDCNKFAFNDWKIPSIFRVTQTKAFLVPTCSLSKTEHLMPIHFFESDNWCLKSTNQNVLKKKTLKSCFKTFFKTKLDETSLKIMLKTCLKMTCLKTTIKTNLKTRLKICLRTRLKITLKICL